MNQSIILKAEGLSLAIIQILSDLDVEVHVLASECSSPCTCEGAKPDLEVRLPASHEKVSGRSLREKTAHPFPSVASCTYCDGMGLFIRQNDYYRKYLYSQISWVESSGSYSYIHMQDLSKILVAHPLAAIERKLPADRFMRIHRRYIVHLVYVDAFIGNMVCIGKERLSVSSHCREKLYSCFKFLDCVKNKTQQASIPVAPVEEQNKAVSEKPEESRNPFKY